MSGYVLEVGIVALIYMLLTLGLSLHYGFTGLINFGHVAFFALGAYASALITMRGGGLALGLLAAMLLAALSALPLGWLSLRLRTDYLAIVTLGFSEVVRLAIVNERWLTKGVQGIPGVPDLARLLGVPVPAMLVALVLLVLANGLAILAIRRIVRSPFGRIIEAIRDDEDAVKALGKDPGGFKTRVFMIGAALAGLAGAVHAHHITYISPDSFTPLVTFYVWVAMILGGAGQVAGAAIGALVLILFLEGSRFLRDVIPGVSAVEMASVRLFAVGLALILLVLYRPGGLMGKDELR